jgi:hypothetical protein
VDFKNICFIIVAVSEKIFSQHTADGFKKIVLSILKMLKASLISTRFFIFFVTFSGTKESYPRALY